MATPALCNQVAEKWQRSFTKLNREKEGITGLLEFSNVCLYRLSMRPAALMTRDNRLGYWLASN